MAPARVSGGRVLLTVALWLVGGAVVVVATLFGFRLLSPAWARAHAADLAAVALLEAYAALLATLLLVFGGVRGLRDRLGFRYTAWWHLGAALIAWMLSLLVGGLLTFAFSPFLGPPENNAADVLHVASDPFFVAVVVPTIALLAPVCEELLFRGVLYGWLRTRIPVAAAVPVSAAVFAGAHTVPSLLPVLFVFGAAAALVYEWTGSTLNSFAMHATQNTLAVVATYLALASGTTR